MAVGRSLAKKPDERFPSCSEFIAALGGKTAVVPRCRPRLMSTVTDRRRQRGPSNNLHTSSINGTSGPQSRAAADPRSAAFATDRPATSPRPKLDPVARPGHDHDAAARRHVPCSAPLAAMPTAPAEQTGPGSLMPAVVIGIGRSAAGLSATSAGPSASSSAAAEAVPHLRLLTVDTDVDAVAQTGTTSS